MIRSFCAAAALLPVAALAQSVPPEPEADVVVVGSGLPAPPGEAAYAVTEIEAERLASVASGRLEDALRDAAGIAQFRRSDSRSANPTSQGITLRGLGGNASSRALLLLYVVPQTDPFGGWVAFPAYLPDRLRGARVTRGGGSGYQGPGALAGTVELFSAGPDTLAPLSVRALYGSRDALELVGVAAARLGEGTATLAIDHARGDGFAPIVAEDRGPVDRAAPYDQASAALRLVTPLTATSELQTSLAAFRDRRDRGTDFTGIESDGADASARLVGRGRWGYALTGYLQTRRFASGFASVDAARASVAPVLDQYNVPATGIGARAELSPPIGDGITLRLGGDVRRVSGRTRELFLYVAGQPTRRREAGGVNLTAGGFVDGSYEAGPLTLSAGGRVDRWRIADGAVVERPLAGGAAITDLAYAPREGTGATGRIGAAYRVTDAVAVRAAGYRGWRLPTLNELYRPFRVGNDLTTANADLSPERLTGIEAGLDLSPLPALTARATLFWNRLDDAVANVTIASAAGGAVTRQRRNIEAIRARGVEFDVGWTRGPLGLTASYAFTDARVRGRGAAVALDGLRPAQTARHQASGTIGWDRAGWGAALTARYVAPQFEDDANSRRLTDALTLDARVAAPLASGLLVEARAENLTDTRVEAAISAAGVVERATPRTLWVGLRYRLE